MFQAKIYTFPTEKAYRFVANIFNAKKLKIVFKINLKHYILVCMYDPILTYF